ncbi:NAD(P)/FAD-dependent oxidoreductase [Paenibacillus radicis (ex Xue et al. 2023)]|uniref:FAD-dependent oxidoreductase n=1 Tax=Paenibacillus radicis (ex Xue et al. 2023) TaxID=2972489 RepID=A0ABT1YB19_9BACL|nr:FAD-dependent oxidoreductase [Paenibacillus radicis (ex Xue et al. 2023)]MCR8630378.1 FAD-dependent oxidoreductase [Paenibacillus radicis (ex Xue et al. 2023)]
MKELTCIVVGGGYAGINAVKAIRKTFSSEAHQFLIRIVLIDKNSYHLRKVLLFKPAAGNDDIIIPLARLFPEGIELIQATVTKIEREARRLYYKDSEGNENFINYNVLVMTLGSIIRKPDTQQGGVALASLEEAQKIRETWRTNLKKAVNEINTQERQRLMTIAIAGAGISGIETSAELAHFVRKDAQQLGLIPSDVKIYLFNMNKRLFPEGPAKVGVKLERAIEACGVTVIHDCKVLEEREGALTLSYGKTMSVGLCIWTLGLLPNPMLRSIGMPVNSDGYVIVDESYRVQDAQDVYSIGDCARIVDPSGRADGKTCKEATAQAARLAKILAADLTGRPAPVHKGFIDFFCFGLGPEQGIAWTRKWGIDVIFTGKLGWRMRKVTWDLASLLK